MKTICLDAYLLNSIAVSCKLHIANILHRANNSLVNGSISSSSEWASCSKTSSNAAKQNYGYTSNKAAQTAVTINAQLAV